MSLQTGVLLLSSNKTYGRIGKKLLYQCIPYDKTASIVLIPYEIKLQFSKHIKNKFISYQLNRTQSNHTGQLMEVFGDVDNLEAYYEYQTVSRELRFSKRELKTDYHWIDDTVERRFNGITIDNEGTKDFDDAFSLETLENGDKRLSIYIINVARFVHHFQLWDKLRETSGSTIYLPHRKINILPSSLIDNCLSLKQGTTRYTIGLDVVFDPDGNIVDTSIKEYLLKIERNFVYDSKELTTNQTYQSLFALTTQLVSLEDSHQFVGYWMEFYSRYFAKNIQDPNFIYLHHHSCNNNVSFLERYIINQSFPKGYYTYDDKNPMDYVHCTSPIRRMVDIYNQGVFIKRQFDPPLNIDWLNHKTKQVKKLQMETQWMNLCFSKTETMEKTFEGILLDYKLSKSREHKYTVYLKELKMISYFKCVLEYPLFSQHLFRIYLFKDEYDVNKKVRLCLVV